VRSNRIVVIGAGMGGLAAALELSAGGTEVIVVERGEAPGGKIRQIPAGMQAVDAGPTVLTMRWVFDELFAAAGMRLDDTVGLRRAGLLARHAWSTSERLDLFADPGDSAEAIGAFAGPAEARRYRRFCRHAQRTFEALYRPFMCHPHPAPTRLVRAAGPRRLPDLVRARPFADLWHLIADHFRDPRLRQLFARYATYCGSSPYQASATLALIAHVEQAGVHVVDGGMTQLARAVAGAATACGATFRYATAVDAIDTDARRATGVRLDTGEHVAADAIVANADVASLAAGKLGPDAAEAVDGGGERSLSALTWTGTATPQGFDLAHHNVFFGRDYAAEFRALFDERRVPAEPTIYICAQDREADGTRRGSGAERMLAIINAPPTGDQADFSDAASLCQQRLRTTLARCGLHLERDTVPATITSPADFERMFPGTGGALYGRAVHGWRAPFARPTARSALPGLYLAGGGVHPGPGVPVVALSGRLAAARVLADLAKPR